jgi:O-succinylbenzoate synthase
MQERRHPQLPPSQPRASILKSSDTSLSPAGAALLRPADDIARDSGPFRLERIDAMRVGLLMHEPFRISSGSVSRKIAILVKVQDEGAFGWGESSAMPGSFYSAETPETCQEELLEHVLPALAGRTFQSMVELEGALRQLATTPFVRVAVETAAWELVARRRGVSLRELFGIADRPVPCGLAVGLYDTDDALYAAFKRYNARDYKRVKIKIQPGRDITAVRAARAALADFPLFVDANAAYTRDDIRLFRELDEYDLLMFEQPLAKDDLEGSALLQNQVQTSVCLDESIGCLDDVIKARALGACRIVNVKLQRVGGFLEALRVVEFCAFHGIYLWMGTMPETGIGSAQALVLAAHPAFAFPTDVEPSARWYREDLLVPELRMCAGQIAAPHGPGLGYRVDEEQVKRWTVASWSFGRGAA